MIRPSIAAASAAFLLSGCIVADVVTAPVKVAAGTIDLLTESQAEKDEKRGRELRKREERLGKLERDYAKQLRKCDEGDAKECAKARATWNEMEALRPTIPVEPD
ncbi:hypothetical protein GCM10010923_23840 [Blastomonas marina]|uniref:Lipoprotein n=1 Tax=Blastomonas marina TaxID=1867408 RepID=A0ABQ1FHH0_9SPHN|nr:DUF6726 family protein [Blastomonas marina]GGA12319.1 hypothetical protein GCM10010923_23840 [Blastomonas marina]